MRLGLGEVTNSELQKADARHAFLCAIESEAPEVLETLLNDVFPVYAAICDQKPLFWRVCPPEVKMALANWGKRFNLDFVWIYEHALDTMELWKLCPVITENRPLNWPVFNLWPAWFSPGGGVFSFNTFWDPVEEGRKEVIRRIQKEFEEQLQVFMDETEAQYKTAGWIKTKVKRKRISEDPLLHFRWAVRRIVQRWKYSEILEFYHPEGDITEDAVKHAVKDVLNLIR